MLWVKKVRTATDTQTATTNEIPSCLFTIRDSEAEQMRGGIAYCTDAMPTATDVPEDAKTGTWHPCVGGSGGKDFSFGGDTE